MMISYSMLDRNRLQRVWAASKPW